MLMKVWSKCYLKAMDIFDESKKAIKNERGIQTIEWVALAAVVLFLMVAVAKAMKGQGAGLAGVIVGKIGSLLGEIGS